MLKGGLNMEGKTKIKIEPLKNIKICPYCLGDGKLKAMQRANISNGISIRYKDTTVKCKYCNGAGIIE